MPRTTELGKIPAVDLAYAVDRLIQEGKTSLAEVRRFADERPARIAALERELVTLKAGHAAAKAAGRPAGPRAAAAKKPKRKFTMTARARAARKRQGQYLAALKRLKGVERARVKTVARKEGVAKAVELARKTRQGRPAQGGIAAEGRNRAQQGGSPEVDDGAVAQGAEVGSPTEIGRASCRERVCYV